MLGEKQNKVLFKLKIHLSEVMNCDEEQQSLAFLCSKRKAVPNNLTCAKELVVPGQQEVTSILKKRC